MNRVKTAMLLGLLTALLLWGGHALGGATGLVFALFFAVAMNFGSYWFSDKIVLRMYGAQEVTESQAPGLYGIVRELAMRGDLPMPRVYVIPEEQPNAFATGRNPRNAAVAVTQGLLRALDRDEIAGVLAHELGHVRHRDTLIMTVAATIAGALSMLANMAMWSSLLGGRSDDEEGNPAAGLLGLLVAPIAAGLIQMAISRSREYMADEYAARLTAQPMSLATALKKIQRYSQQVPMHHGSPATAHLFIQNPFSGAAMANLFSTHPPTEKRIEKLEGMALRGGFPMVA